VAELAGPEKGNTFESAIALHAVDRAGIRTCSCSRPCDRAAAGEQSLSFEAKSTELRARRTHGPHHRRSARDGLLALQCACVCGWLGGLATRKVELQSCELSWLRAKCTAPALPPQMGFPPMSFPPMPFGFPQGFMGHSYPHMPPGPFTPPHTAMQGMMPPAMAAALTRPSLMGNLGAGGLGQQGAAGGAANGAATTPNGANITNGGTSGPAATAAGGLPRALSSAAVGGGAAPGTAGAAAGGNGGLGAGLGIMPPSLPGSSANLLSEVIPCPHTPPCC
jgi:hypothetical protein